jgi:ribosome-associated protein
LSKRRSSAGEPVAAPAGSAASAAAPEPSDAQAGDGGDAAPERPSRSARKRQAEALQKLGVGLTRMRPAKLHQLQAQLQLPELLFEAILEAQRLRSGGALARQRQYIGRLMRDIDAAPIERALAAFRSSGDAKLPR